MDMAPVVALGTLAALCPVFGLLIWLGRRGMPAGAPDVLVFQHSAWLRLFALCSAFGIPAGIAVLAFFHPPRNESDTWAMLFCFALFAGLSGPLLWEAYAFALVVSEDGLLCRSPWRGQWFIPWREVEEVYYAKQNSYFIIRNTRARKFRVPTMVPGLARFLERCERHLPWAALRNARPGYAQVKRPFPLPVGDEEVRSKWRPRDDARPDRRQGGREEDGYRGGRDDYAP